MPSHIRCFLGVESLLSNKHGEIPDSGFCAGILGWVHHDDWLLFRPILVNGIPGK